MTSQEKKKYLLRYRYLSQEVERLSAERAAALSKARKITPTLSDMPKAQSGANGLELAVEDIIKNADELSEKIVEMNAVKCEIESVIDSLEDDTLRQLMKYHYINGMTWEEVAVKMNYSYRNITRMHGRALVVLVCPI